MLTSQAILKTLDRPRKLPSILAVVDPGGSEDALRVFLAQMRERGFIRLDRKGRWFRY